MNNKLATHKTPAVCLCCHISRSVCPGVDVVLETKLKYQRFNCNRSRKETELFIEYYLGKSLEEKKPLFVSAFCALFW